MTINQFLLGPTLSSSMLICRGFVSFGELVSMAAHCSERHLSCDVNRGAQRLKFVQPLGKDVRVFLADEARCLREQPEGPFEYVHVDIHIHGYIYIYICHAMYIYIYIYIHCIYIYINISLFRVLCLVRICFGCWASLVSPPPEIVTSALC